MSKELDRLDHLRIGIQYINQDESPAFISQYEEDIGIIETALIEKINTDNLLNDIHNSLKEISDEELTMVDKKLKALEIIKKKRIDFITLSECVKRFKDEDAFEEYNAFAEGNLNGSEYVLTQEEFDLLRGWLL